MFFPYVSWRCRWRSFSEGDGCGLLGCILQGVIYVLYTAEGLPLPSRVSAGTHVLLSPPRLGYFFSAEYARTSAFQNSSNDSLSRRRQST